MCVNKSYVIMLHDAIKYDIMLCHSISYDIILLYYVILCYHGHILNNAQATKLRAWNRLGGMIRPFHTRTAKSFCAEIVRANISGSARNRPESEQLVGTRRIRIQTRDSEVHK